MGATAQQGVEDELGRLTRLGFSKLAECLLSAPKLYLDFTAPVRTVAAEHVGSKRYFQLTLQRKSVYNKAGQECRLGKDASRVVMDTCDTAGKQVRATVFGNIWPWKDAAAGELVHVYGELTVWNEHLQLNSPALVPPRDRGRIATVYPGKRGQVKGDLLADAVQRALHRIDEGEMLLLAQAGMHEREFVQETGLASGGELLRRLHAPAFVDEALQARAIARRMCSHAIVRKAVAARTRPAIAASAIPVSREVVAQLIAALPYRLTNDQARAIDEIVGDLRSPYPMRRLLSGDVGTGKSIAFMVPAVAAARAGASVAILAPSQLVVEQVASEMRSLFPGVVVSEVLAGGKLGDGIVVGTTALLKAAAKAKRCFDLVVTDEQHKFSVEQKSGLTVSHTNVLEATATAIPRTLALVNFGGMDVSLLRESPVPKHITTRVTRDSDMPRLTRFFDEVLARKAQIAVIYPFVDAGDSTGAEAQGGTPNDHATVGAAAQRWEKRFPGRVGMLHGRMSPEEKTAVVQAMHAGSIDILISSLVIEVGVTLPSLKAMLVVHPERYGVSQLHQLRGRLSRKGGRGYLFLHVGAGVEPDALARLQLLVECGDGFTLAERDMDLRGFGDVDDDSQSQTGATRSLFWGISLSHRELAEAAQRMGVPC